MALSNKFIIKFCGTMYNMTKSEFQTYVTDKLNIQYMIAGYETCPSTGKKHIQFYIELKKKKRERTIGKILQCFVKQCYGTHQENVDYCTKEDRAGFLEVGCRSEKSTARDRQTLQDRQNKRLVRLACQSKFGEVIRRYPSYVVRSGLRNLREIRSVVVENEACRRDGMMAIWLFGPPGTGKSRWARSKFPGAYYKFMDNFFQGYNGQDVIIYDDFTRQYVHEHRLLLILAEDNIRLCNLKHGHELLRHRVLIVCSMYHPAEFWEKEELKAIERRFLICNAISYDKMEKDLLVDIMGRCDINNYIGQMLHNVFLWIFLLNFDI
jgi:hypothetical protein